MARTVLFYKRLISVGGAELLLARHYAYLKARGHAPEVLCFEHAKLERIDIDAVDLICISGQSRLTQLMGLARALAARRGARFFCHSGHIEFGLAARMARVPYGIFLHQPTSMSFNESDKYAARYWPRFCAFASHHAMFTRLRARRAALPLPQRLYINLRAMISQAILRRATDLFVLSPYAVREKAEVFGLCATYAAGALTPERVAAVAAAVAGKNALPGAEARPITLVTLSRLDKNKRIDILIDAVVLLRRRGRDVGLRIGGCGPEMEALKTHAQAVGAADIVRFLGYVPEADIAALYAEMDIFVTIDWADFRITTYEVLAENRRVVVSDDTDADAALLASGYLFTAPADAACLANVIETALATPVTWTNDRLAAYLGQFTWPNYFDRIGAALGGGDA